MHEFFLLSVHPQAKKKKKKAFSLSTPPVMLTKTKVCLLLVLCISLFVASQCNEYKEDPDEDLHRCQLRCVRPLRPFREQAACEQRCLEKYRATREPTEPVREDPSRQLEKCKRECLEEEQGPRYQEYCERQCELAYGEREHQYEEQRGGGGGGEGSVAVENDHHHHDPEGRYRRCQHRCQSYHGHTRQHCQQQCEEEYKEAKERQGRGEQGGETNPEIQTRRKEQREQNPYYFEGQRFVSRFRTLEGHFSVLERFSKRSELLQGIENNRLAVLEANPRTFMIPHHCDAEAVFYVAGGQGTISFVHKNKRDSYNLQRGYVTKVPAGSTVYLINQDDNEKLQIVMLFHPVNTPGRFEEYFGVGGENPESFYRVFGDEILEAAFNTPRDRLDRLFGQQKKGIFVKASEEQIRALSQAGESRERGEYSRGPYHLLKERPQFSSRFGKFYEASPDDYQQLRNIDASVAFMNIKQGGMIVPYYNSRSTKMVYVARGSGYFEMACPHLARQSQGSQENTRGVHYQKVTSRLSVGDVFIIPAGHPITIVASPNEDLQLVGFGIKAHNDQKIFLAGRDNIWQQVESEAKELTFQVPSREVDEIFRSQDESHFVAGPQKREAHRRVGDGSLFGICFGFSCLSLRCKI